MGGKVVWCQLVEPRRSLLRSLHFIWKQVGAEKGFKRSSESLAVEDGRGMKMQGNPGEFRFQLSGRGQRFQGSAGEAAWDQAWGAGEGREVRVPRDVWG